MKKLYLLTVLCLFACVVRSSAQLTAFPTAEGAGKFVTGGRGANTSVAPTVLEVTTLVDNASSATTPGTFRYACTRSGFAQRIIVFRVSGTIHLYAALNINRSNTTIAGQTAPGEGICIADHPVRVSAGNVIIRYLRFRLGDKNQAASNGNGDGLEGVGAQRVIIDHCSISWSNDEACTFYNGDYVTLQWNIISEPLDYSYHDEGTGIQNHAYGGIFGGRRASFHHNLIAHCRGRMPRFDGIRNSPADTADFRNNVIYNWADYTTNGGEGGTYNVVNNYYKYGPSTPNNSSSGVNRRSMLINPYRQSSPLLPYGRYYLSGNYSDNSATVTGQNWRGAAFNSGSLADSAASKVTVPFNCININTQSAEEAYRDVLAMAGCSLPNRDTLDQRIVNDVRNRTGRLINVQGGFPAGTPYTVSQIAWPSLANGTAQTDTDKDGMPNNWELARGLNPQNAADLNGYVSTSGYSNIENYINGDTIVALGKTGTCISAKSMSSQNSGQWIFARDSTYSHYLSTSYTAATDSNHMVAAILDNGNFGMLNTSYYTAASVRLDPFASKPLLNRNITITPASTLAANTPITARFYLSLQEFNALKAADPLINTVADLVILRSANNGCVTALTSAYAVIEPVAYGVFGTYRLGYFIEFQTNFFGSFFVGSRISFPLPLTLVSLNVVNENNRVHLHWITENEINSSHFVVEKSTDGVRFFTAGTVISTNTASRNHYSFTSEEPFLTTVYYRLKILDRDGKFFYSHIVLVRKNNSAVILHPNPVMDQLLVSHPVTTPGSQLRVMNVDGKEMMRLKLQTGSMQSAMDTRMLPPGMYVLIYTNNTTITSVKFLKH